MLKKLSFLFIILISLAFSALLFPAYAVSYYGSYTIKINDESKTLTTNSVSHDKARVYFGHGLCCEYLDPGKGTHNCCAAYQALMYKQLWGKPLDNPNKEDPNRTKDMISKLSAKDREITVEHCRQFFMQAKPGAAVTMRKSDVHRRGNEGHSMIFLKATENKGVFWSGNDTADGKIKIYEISWEDFVKKYTGQGKKYFTYIKWPGATPYVPYNVLADNLDEYRTVAGITPNPYFGSTGFLYGNTYSGPSSISVYSTPNSSGDPCETRSVLSYFHVTQIVEGSDGKQWYKLDKKEKFIQADKLSSEIWFKQAPNVQLGIYKANQSTLWGKAPFDARDQGGGSIDNGQEEEVIRAVINKYDNLWYQIEPEEANKWVLAERFDFVRSVPTISISGVAKPTGYREKGKGMELKGTITSSENIVSVSGAVIQFHSDTLPFLDLSFPEFSTHINPAVISPNAKSVNINTYKLPSPNSGYSINTALKIGELPEGNYRYKITATTSSGYSKVLVDEPFTVYDTTEPPPMADVTTIPASSIELNTTSIDLQKGESYRILAAVKPDNVTNGNVSFRSSNSSIVTVDSSGMVYAKDNGSAMITVSTTDGTEISKTISVTVSEPVTVIDLETSICIEVGKPVQLHATCSTGVPLVWMANENNVHCRDDGMIFGISPGEAIVTVSAYNDSTVFAQCTVTVVAPDVIDEIHVDDQLNYTLNDMNGFAVAKFTPLSAGHYTFCSLGDTDTYACIYDSNWDFILSNDDGGDDRNFLIQWYLEADVPYYIVVKGYDLYTQGSFCLQCKRSILSITEDVTELVKIAEPGMMLYYKFIPSQTANYTIFSSGTVDTLGYIYDSDWNMLASDDDSGVEYNYVMNYSLKSGNIYYIGTRLWSNFTGEYSIKATASSPFSGTCGDNLYWNFADGMLQITGTGDMYDYLLDAPWNDFIDNIREIWISDGVTSIGREAFYRCVNATKVSIPDSVTKIGEAAFYHCESLAEIWMPEYMESIGETAFAYCKSLTAISFPVSLSAVPEGCFNNCTNLRHIDMPDFFTEIGEIAFAHCNNLTSFEIPESVQSVGYGAFACCDSLERLTVKGMDTNFGEDVCAQSPDVTFCCRFDSLAWQYAVNNNIPVEIYTPVMSYDEFNQAEPDVRVVVETYVQAHQSWVDNHVIVYAQDEQGAYYINNMACSITDASKLVPGTKIHVEGYKNVWYGETEITDAQFRILDTDTYIADATDVTDELGTDSLINHQNEKVVFRDLIVEAFNSSGAAFAYENPSDRTDDLHFKVSKDGHVYEFCVEYNLCGSETEVYKAVENLQVGDVIDCEGFLCWYNDPYPHITAVTVKTAGARCGENLVWNYETPVLTVSGTGDMYDYSLDNTPWVKFKDSIELVIIDDGVIGICDYAFAGCKNLRNVIISNNVISIGNQAFASCPSLTGIEVGPDNPSYTSADGVLYSRDMKNLITYPIGKTDLSYSVLSGVKVIEGHAFEGAKNLKHIDLPSNVTSIGSSAFASSGLTAIRLPDSIWKIEAKSFQYCYDLQEVVLPSGIFSIDEYAFGSCIGLKDIMLPKFLSTLGAYAFYGCESLEIVAIPQYASVSSTAFDACDNVIWLVIPDSVAQQTAESRGIPYIVGQMWGDLMWTLDDNGVLMIYDILRDSSHIMDNLGYDHSNAWQARASEIREAVIQRGIQNIGDHAFYGCNNLSSVSIPDSIVSIGHNAFQFCYSLRNITIPQNVETIGSFVFSGCTGLESFNVHALNRYYSSVDGVLFDKVKKMLLYYPMKKADVSYSIPNDVISIEGDAFDGNHNLTSIIIPQSVSELRGYTIVNNCTSLAAIHVKDGNACFSSKDGVLFDKSGITLIKYPFNKPEPSYTIPDGVTTIGQYALENCSNLKKINIPDTVTSIGQYGFGRCINLESIALPNSVKNIEDHAFEQCTRMTKAIIPSSVTSIGDHAFQECPNLTLVVVEGSYAMNYAVENSIPYRSNDAWGNLLWSLDADGVLQIYGTGEMNDFEPDSREAWRGLADDIKHVFIQDGVTSIGECAFNNCDSLMSISLSKSIANIGKMAFGKSNHSLRSINVDDDNMLYSTANGVLYNKAQSELLFYPAGKSDTSFTIPNNVISIADGAFCSCDNLSSINITDSVSSIGAWAFMSCDYLSNIRVSSGNAVYSSSDGVVFNKNQNVIIRYPSGRTDNQFNIPDIVTTLAEGAFSYCKNLKSITIPANVTSIHVRAFEPNYLEYLNCYDAQSASCAFAIENKMPYRLNNGRLTSTITWMVSGDTLVISGSGDMVGVNQNSVSGWGLWRNEITKVIIQPEITRIGKSFMGFTKLTDLTIPGSVREIELEAFSGCSALEKVIIPSGVNIIKGGAFRNCTSLKQISLPDSLTEIWAYAFFNCPAMEMIVIPTSVIEIDKYAFTNYNSNYQLNPNFKIACYRDSVAHTYAEQYGLPYIIIDEYALESFDLNTEEEWLFAGDTLQLSVVNIQPADAETAISWSSSNTDVATVDSNGLVTVIGPGDVTICAEDIVTAFTRQALLHIFNQVTEIELEPVTYMVPGEERQLTANVTMGSDSCVNQMITFVSGVPAVVMVDEVTGIVTAVTHGEATISATAANGVSATVTISVHVPETIPAMEPTCAETGLTEGSYCSVCGEILVAQEEVAALGHEWNPTEYVWAENHLSVTATRVCARDESHIETGTAEATAAETKAATCSERGETTYTSAAFENEAFEIQSITLDSIPMLPHTLTSHDRVEPTCTMEGTEVYWQCDDCGKYFMDENAENEIEAPVVIEKKAHTLTAHAMVDSTCTVTGTEAYWSCVICEELFSDEEAANEIEAPVVIEKKAHTLTAHAKVDSTCTATGIEAYWSCDVCEKLFSDEDAKNDIDTPVVIAAKGHEWDKADYEWSLDFTAVTATHTCKHDASHTETETVDVTFDIVSPTETTKGSITYTSTEFTKEGFSVQTKSIEIPALENMTVLRLPKELVTVEDEAFSNLVCEAVIIPDGCTSIGENAFAGCVNLRYVRIPASITTYPDSAFTDCNENLVIDWAKE